MAVEQGGAESLKNTRARSLARVAILVAVLLAQSGSRAEEESAQPAHGASDQAGVRITLAEALRAAEANNPTLEVARARLLEAEGQFKASWAALLPVARGSLTFTHNDHADLLNFGGASVVARRQDDLAGGLQVDVPLVNPRAWLGVSQAGLAEEMAALGMEQTRQLLLLQVAQGYFQALTARDMIDVIREQMKSSERHRAVAELHHRSGTGARLDVIRASTEILASREQLASAEAAWKNACDALATLCGIEKAVVPVEEPPLKGPAASAEEFEKSARERREDLRLARHSVQLAERNLTGSWMQFLPSLNGSWQLSYQITDPSSLRSDDKTRWFYLITLSVPIYEHTRYADLDQKRAAVLQAQAELRDAEQRALLEVRQLRRDYERALRQITIAAENARLSAEALQLAESAYQNGTGGSLEVTDARRSSRQADINLALKRFDAQLALLSLLRAAGENMARLPEMR